MSMWMYAVPVGFIALMLLIMMPIMKRQANKTNAEMLKIRNKSVHLTMLAGDLYSVNGTQVSEFDHVYQVYGLDMDGELDIEFLPNFTHGSTTYTGQTQMRVSLQAEAGKSYEIGISPKQPKNDPTVIDVIELSGKELIFKSKFYVIIKDITETQGAKGMRGNING